MSKKIVCFCQDLTEVDIVRAIHEGYDHLETLSTELDFNVMFTRCGYLVLAATDEESAMFGKLVDLQRSQGLDTQHLDRKAVFERVPALNQEAAAGGILQPAGGFARHDAVVWAYEQACRRTGVQVAPYTEVKNIIVTDNTVTGVETTKGSINTGLVVNAAGGHAREIAAKAGADVLLVEREAFYCSRRTNSPTLSKTAPGRRLAFLPFFAIRKDANTRGDHYEVFSC
jgi:glycine/D-amino acid oxidase-like deaminating enzyme